MTYLNTSFGCLLGGSFAYGCLLGLWSPATYLDTAARSATTAIQANAASAEAHPA